MPITIVEPVSPIHLEPIEVPEPFAEISLGGYTFEDALHVRLSEIASKACISIAANFWPSRALLKMLLQENTSKHVVDDSGAVCLACTFGEDASGSCLPVDGASTVVRYPWHLLDVNEDYLSSLGKPFVAGTIREGATVDGILHLGKGSVILPGVFIEGTVAIGENCKIGPNCYLRGTTSIGDNCRIGQSVEVKNSIVMAGTAIGHLSYVGDSVIGRGVNIGAGTISANFRHDGATHRSRVGNELVDTGRLKFGTIIGNNVHTGIHTSIYPGRKLGASCSTLPGAIISDDVAPPEA